MAFKTESFAPKAAANPALHFKTLTKRHFPDVMPHQKEMLEEYATKCEKLSDVALQLPTGSGKTLVGLLIADWRRRKCGDRALYLCPTKQLVRQTVQQASEQYGIDVVDLSGRKKDFSSEDRAAYKLGKKVAISTYSGLFNTNTFFDDPDLVVIDDAHAAENYIASMWSLDIPSGSSLYSSLAEFLHPHIGAQAFARMTGDWVGPADSMWVDKLPTPLLGRLTGDIEQIIDAHAGPENPDFYYTWSLLREHLDACHIYLSAKEILVRPLIPPTFTHSAFSQAKQRLFMSATLGAGGDLERLTGRSQIHRLAAPDGFQTAGVGRRFFIFPTLSCSDEESDTVRLTMQEQAGRSVVLTPSMAQAVKHSENVRKHLHDFTVFSSADIEDDKHPFVSSSKAVAILANRYDGIDFPGDQCRLLCVDGLPRAMNGQERFLMSKLGASAIYNDRVQTRVLQAMGRCTRALQDRSAVVVTGTELVDYLANDRRWKYFPSELQAELKFGVDQSTDVAGKDFLENFEMFMANDTAWGAADSAIRHAMENFTQEQFPAMKDLASVVRNEIAYQQAIWNKDYVQALAATRAILGDLNHQDLRGYRALWHYLSASLAARLSKRADDDYARSANEQFLAAKRAAPSVSWLNTLLQNLEPSEQSDEHAEEETDRQVEAIVDSFLIMGTATNHKFEKKVQRIADGLTNESSFEVALVGLGEVLGFTSGNDESDAAPDPWWLGYKMGIVFEAHAGGNDSTVFGATKARQASGHPKWIRKMVPGTVEMEIEPVLITPCTKAKSGADPHLEDVRYWHLELFRKWAIHAIAVLRELKGTFPGEADLAWRAEAASRLETEGLTIKNILVSLQRATEAMEIVP
jgi:hypothetical protein